jgi:two-component system alkaline phosphatase synthesis response regulator PhoP
MAGQTILIIEDDESLCEVLGVALKIGGYQSAMAHDGIQAMSKVRQVKPALIILDFMFPAGGGMSAHKRLRTLADTKRTPIIMLTSTCEEVVAKAVDMDGNTYYLAKPYKREMLLSLVNQILS